MFVGKHKILVAACAALGLMTSACSEVTFVHADFVPGSSSSLDKSYDSFVQDDESRSVDIIVVVDNSPSMANEQKKLGEKIESFINSLDAVNWQLAITTTDVSNGKYGLKGSFLKFAGTDSYILKPTTPNYKDLFVKTIRRKESRNCFVFNCASSNEQPLKATLQAIEKRDSDNAGFFRDKADLAIIYISDEDEKSTGPRNATQPLDVFDAVKDLWPAKSFTAFGIIIEPGDEQCKNGRGNNQHYGDFVHELSILTNGFTGSLCERDYGPTLSRIGENVRSLSRTFELKYLPKNDVVSIKMLPEQNFDWELEGKVLTITPAPMDGTIIEVSYDKAD